MKFNKWSLRTATVALAAVAALAFSTFTAPAQNPPISASTIDALLQNGLITVGTPATINGQTFLVTTNASGGYVIASTGPNGSLTVTPPTTLNGAYTSAQEFINANNPTNADLYGTNELVARLGTVYLQNSGQAVVEIGVEKYGWFDPNIGLGAALFQGNQNGKSGTAGGVGFIDYRKVIGDVSAQIGIGGGYDNWNASAMGVIKADIEYRQNKHLGEYVGVGYAIEKGSFGASSGADPNKGGLMVRGGINYAF
jgi:hypothetical protein